MCELLVLQPLERAGFYATGEQPKSATKSLTFELEARQADKLGDRIVERLPRSSYKRWPWEACTEYSGMFLLSPPDCLGYVKRPLFQVAVLTYLGQPCPLMAPLVGHYFGKKESQLDGFGANLAATPLPEYGWRVLHGALQ